jgi:hypothetical protein
MVILVVPPTHEVHHEEDDGHPSRDEENGSHRLLLLLLRRCLTSGLLLRLLWLSATGSRQLIAEAEATLEEASGVIANGYLWLYPHDWVRAVEKRRAALGR